MTAPATTINARITDLINKQVEAGRQIGVQVTAYHNGEVVVDTVAGTMGPDDKRPMQKDTLVLAYSLTKGIAGTLVHMLADRGVIEYDAPVAKYWPAFGQHGKDKLTVAQALTHQAGLHRMPEPFKVEHLTDWDAGIKRMEEGVPAYEPGTATGYHAVTHAWIVGGLVQGATGTHIKDLIESEIAKPLGVSGEMYVGIPDGVEDRLATLEIATIGDNLPIPEDAEMFKAMPKQQWQHFNDMDVRKACLPSGNGHFTARAVAKMYAALAGDGSIDGVRLVKQERLQHMNRLITDATDVVIGVPMRKAIGFFLGGETAGIHGPIGARETAFGHPGAGGPVGFADPEAKLAVGVISNKMTYPGPGEGVTLEICDAIRDELGVG
jgi:CubicO group peptidase (beta-lactamase class C family)